MHKYKVVIDVNVWVSVIIKHQLFNLLNAIKNNNITIYICDELTVELYDVLYRPKHYKNLQLQIDEYLNRILFVSTFHSIKQHRFFKDCRDPDDNYLFDLAIQSQADYLVTGDKIVLETPINPPTKIITFSEFREMFS